MGPATPRSTVLTEVEEAMIVEFRRRTLLPLDDVRRTAWFDVLGCLKNQIPKLTRSALHRCLQHPGISWLPRTGDAGSKRKAFKETRIGYVEFHDSSGKMEGVAFLRGIIAAFLYKLHTVLIDNGVAFTKNASTKWDLMRRV